MIMYLAPVTVFWSQTDFWTMSAFSCSSVSATAPCFLRSATVVPGLATFRASALGGYQIGELPARSWGVGAAGAGGGAVSFAARIGGQRGRGVPRPPARWEAGRARA